MVDTTGYTEHTQANSIKIGDYCLIKDHPCKVVETAWSKPGKHGSGKIRMIGIDIFTGDKVENSTPSTAMVERVIVTRVDYQLLDIQDDYCTLVCNNGNNCNEISLKLPSYPPKISEEIKEAFENGDDIDVTVISAMGTDAINAFKINK